ncbi:MAG: hypothetical protein IID33_09125, partial [Planctomycetes bacterium]|nr:hypothetical protein [Planctomycetota bacterium]
MNNDEIRGLCLELLRADSESAVIDILTEAGLWDDLKSWRQYGDIDGNFATIGNQQSRPEAALVEKIVNSVDARLMAECMRRGIDAASPQAPPTIAHAVSQFVDGRPADGELTGTVQQRTAAWKKQEQMITLSATGSRQTPCLVITDLGEGQTPARLPDTFLSINRSNKLRIPFVQGKFNMGGTGALKFCGQHSLQLIISRRDPEVVKTMNENDETAHRWGFTIVRRDRPRQGAGQVRNSVFRYLAPVGASERPERGEVLSFSAAKLALMPDGNKAYARPVTHGSCIKLYEYDMKGFKSHVLMKGGLLSRMELLLPEIALPVRIHECRDFRGHAGSFANTLVGLSARLTDNRAGNLENAYPTSASLRVHGHEMIATIYAFKGDKAESYRTNEGIIFTINGQTHGAIPKTFFSRSNVKMGRLAKSLLVVVDCSRFAVDAREDLFMNSRDRLSSGALRKAVEEALEDLISKHPGLRELRERRRNEEIAERLADSKPLEDVLKSVLKSSPSLQKLFLLGQRLSRPHRSGSPGSRPGGGAGADNRNGEFSGRPHPTYFRFHRKSDGETLVRDAESGRRCRIKFETDVVNDYLCRDAYRGRYNVEVASGSHEGSELDNTLTLHNGIGNWSISIPDEDVAEGDELTLLCTLHDDVLLDPFVNVARLKIVAQSTSNGDRGSRTGRGGTGRRGSGGTGAGGTGGTQGDQGPPDDAGIQMPEIIEVEKSKWAQHDFDERSACKVIEDAAGDDTDEKSVYTFYINVDNLFLRTD